MLEELLQNGTCRRVSVLTAGGEETLTGLRELPNSEVYSLSGGILSAGLEEMRV